MKGIFLTFQMNNEQFQSYVEILFIFWYISACRLTQSLPKIGCKIYHQQTRTEINVEIINNSREMKRVIVDQR